MLTYCSFQTIVVAEIEAADRLHIFRSLRVSKQLNPRQNVEIVSLRDVAFFGRNFSEYCQMFNLDPPAWKDKKVLDCASGPSTFAMEANRQGIKTIACDPMYSSNAKQILERGKFYIEDCLKNTRAMAPEIPIPTEAELETFAQEKLEDLYEFENDYRRFRLSRRYFKGALPHLPFRDNSFDLVVLSHFLLLYSDVKLGGSQVESRFDLEFHLASLKELMRVSREEIRIFPLKSPNLEKHPFLEPILSYLKSNQIKGELVPVKYKEVCGADTMLRIVLPGHPPK